MQIKPIETLYNGYRFRSRLEARWAVFFSEMGIAYQYESEGYQLDGGIKYLPDFFLPEFNMFVEVKPNESIDRRSWEKIMKLATDGASLMLLIVGSPGEHGMYFLDRTTVCSWEEYSAETDDVELSGQIFESLKDWANVRFSHLPGRAGWQLVFKEEPPVSECDRELAINNARQARFEHGQSGAPRK